MGTKGREIINLDITSLIEQLNKAYADEWLAYYQYWVGAQVIEGPLRDAATKELTEHALDELRHAEMLSKRIIQLGGKPLLSPEDWYKASTCKYKAPKDPAVKAIVQQNVEGEQCAIGVYHKMMQETQGKDPVTYHMLEQILADEIEHEEDLENILVDLRILTASV